MRLTGSRVYTRPGPVPKMPPGLVEVMEGLTKDVLKNNPTDIYEFCAAHMQQLLEVRDDAPSKKCLTLDQKIAKAQEIVKQRAELRRRKYDKELKLHSSSNLRPIKKEDTISNEAQNALTQEPNLTTILKAPVHHEQDLTDSSEIEISQEKIDSKKNQSYTGEIKEEGNENEGDADAKSEQNTSECLCDDENIDTANNDDTITGNRDRDSNSFESNIDDKENSNVVQKDKNSETVDDLIERVEKQVIDDDSKVSIENNLETPTENVGIDAVSSQVEYGQHDNIEQKEKSDNDTQESKKDIEQHSSIESDNNSSLDKGATDGNETTEKEDLNDTNIHVESDKEDEIPTNIMSNEENIEVIQSGERSIVIEEAIIIENGQRLKDMKDTGENNDTPIINRPESTDNNTPESTIASVNAPNKGETVVDISDLVENNNKTNEIHLEVYNEGSTDEWNDSTVNKNSYFEAIGNLDNVKTILKSKSNESTKNHDIVLITENGEKGVKKSSKDIIQKENSAEVVLASEFQMDNNGKTNLASCDFETNNHKDEQETIEIITEPQDKSRHKREINLSKTSADITSAVQFDPETISVKQTSNIDDTTNSNYSYIEIDTQKMYNDKPHNNNHKSSNMDLETAAITIQKVFRSFLFKSRASTFDDTPNDESNLIEEYVDKKDDNEFPVTGSNSERRTLLGISRMDTVLQTVNEEKSLSLSTDDSSTLSSAATTIQAQVRGFLVRNKFNSNKTLSTNSLVNSEALSTASLEGDTDQHKKTVLNIHIVPEGGHFMSRDESVVTSVDLPFDGSPPSSLNLHPLGYDKSERRKQLKREDAVQSISPPSNNSGKLSEDSVKEVVMIENNTASEKNDSTRVADGATSNTSPSKSIIVETVIENIDANVPSSSPVVQSEAEYAARKETLTKMSSDEMDVVTPFVPTGEKPPSLDTESVPKLLHSGEFHDVLLPTKVMRNNTSVVREFKNVLAYFLIWNNS